jgi:asparagine synthetase A
MGRLFFLPQNIEFCVDKIKVRFRQLPTANKTKLAKKEKKTIFLFSSGSHIENALTLLK